MTSRSSQQSIHQYIEKSATLPGHKLSLTGDFVASNTQLFERVGWRNAAHLIKEGLTHEEINKRPMLDAIQQLGTSKTSSFLIAYVFTNPYRSQNPRQARNPGDVLVIDEKKGVLAAFTSSGVIKTARIDNPVNLRMYLQSEKLKDLSRSRTSSSEGDSP